MNVPMRTATSPSHGMEVGGEGSVGAVNPEPGVGAVGVHRRRPFSGVDFRFHRHAGHQAIGKTVRIVDDDLHRDALHDLGKVARCIVGRQQRELGAGCRAKTPAHARAAYAPERYRP